MKVSILITTFQRPDHLRWCLASLCRQAIPWEHEILVLNDALDDDGTREQVAPYAEQGVRYLFTGQRNAPGKMVWRVPGFALNIGIKQSTGDIVVISSCDIYHLGSTIAPIVTPLLNYYWLLGTMKQVHSDDGTVIGYLRKSGEGPGLAKVIKNLKQQKLSVTEKYFAAHPDMPYLLAVRRKHLLYVGGYDEDFTGYACDDNDLMDRLTGVGCQYAYSNAECIHMFHGAKVPADAIAEDPRYQHNLSLMRRRRGMMHRNNKIEWGKLE